LHVPFDPKLAHLAQIPYTISFVIRKMQQIDNLNELPKDKRPPEDIIWEGTSDDLDEWLDKVLGDPKKRTQDKVQLLIKDDEIEG
jgi:hypothetical protein